MLKRFPWSKLAYECNNIWKWLKTPVTHFGVAIYQTKSLKNSFTNCFCRSWYIPENKDFIRTYHRYLSFLSLLLQAGPLEKVRIAKDKDGRQKSFAFITYCHAVSIPYAIELFRGSSLFNKALLLTFRGRMPFLPPPIRCQGPDSISLQSQDMEQFANMTQNLKEEVLMPVLAPRQTNDSDKLVLASLMGNWSHRHHPYRTNDKHGRNDRPRAHEPEFRSQRPMEPKKHNWSGRRNNRRGYRD